jgi:hypothetical protein
MRRTSLLAPLKSQITALRRSDHAPFWDVDVPALMITDTADYRNPQYHCAQSMPDALADIDYDFAIANVKSSSAPRTPPSTDRSTHPHMPASSRILA